MMEPNRQGEGWPMMSDRSPWTSPSGLKILIPGYPQWSWRQKERALVLFVSYVSAMFVGVISWGTMVGLAVLLFAFLTHAFSIADAIRQCAFPSFGRMVPAITASAGLGAFCYAPALAAASVFAWPIAVDERPRDGYLVNRWAYLTQEQPRPGDTVWLRSSRGARPRIARVLAGSGQRVEWSEQELRIDDARVQDSPFRFSSSTRELKLTIPSDHILVTFGAETQSVPGGWEIVDRADVQGRAWARSYPFWGRRLLR